MFQCLFRFELFHYYKIKQVGVNRILGTQDKKLCRIIICLGIKPGFHLIEVTVGMRHAIHNGLSSLPQVNACASRLRLNHGDIILGTLELAPYVWSILLLSRPINLHYVIPLLEKRLIHQVIVGSEGREHHDR